jgi:hypothetical protein
MGVRAPCSEDDDAIVMLHARLDAACEAWQKLIAKPQTNPI